MTLRSIPRPLRLVASLSAALLGGVPAYAQTDQGAGLLEALSLVSGRMLAAPGLAPEVTQDGDHFHVHIPLPKLATPPDAAVEVTAVPLASGVWDMTGLTFPSAGSLVTQGSADAPPAVLRFSIGQQDAHARVDPTLSLPSAYAVALSDVAVQISGVDPPADMTIGQLTSDGTITGEPGGRMTTRSHTLADTWHLTGTSRTGAAFAVSLGSANMRYDLDGLDRTQAERLRQAVKAVAASQQAARQAPGTPMSPAMRDQLRALIDASEGLLSRLDIEETLHGLAFQAAGGDGTVSDVHLAMAGGADNGRLGGQLDVALDGMTLPDVAPAYALHRVALRGVFSGIPAGELRRLLREALDRAPDPAALLAQAVALLNAPGAQAGIETMTVEAGPLRLQGSAKLRPMPDGTPAIDIHLTAHGVEAMLGLVQSDPKIQQIMPILFIAKGMGKPEGDGLVWDIGFADGVASVNGIPMGHRPGRVPDAHAPVSR